MKPNQQCEHCSPQNQKSIIKEIKKKEANLYLSCCFACNKTWYFHTDKYDNTFVVGMDEHKS